MTDWPKNEWMDQWQALSRQYWSAFQDMTRDAGAKDAAAAMPWQDGFEQWTRMFGDAGKQSETIERVLASAKSFTTFAQAMIAAASAGQGGGMPNWSDALRGNFGMPGMAGGAMPGMSMPGVSMPFGNPLGDALRDVAGKSAKGFEQMMQSFAPMMQGAAPMMQNFGGFDPTKEAKSWLRVPAFGFMREHQEHYQKMAAAMLDYQEQNAKYNALIMRSSQRGFELFESKLAAREEPGRQIDSLRALYDLWVDAAEEAYAEIAMSPEFREVYGNLVNAQMRVRSAMQQEAERVATDFGMPTRTELDSIGQRLHELRRELRAGGRESSATLAREVDKLRREVAELKSALTARDASSRATASNSARAASNESSPRATAAVSAAAAKPVERKRSRAKPAKRARGVAALRAGHGDSVSVVAPARRNAPHDVVAKTPKRASRATKKARAASSSSARSKKSIAKIAHSPTRVGMPATSFADRIAAFARTSRGHVKSSKKSSPLRAVFAQRSVATRGGR
jgi:polyhydroxyalkanoate synthase subunit PhaE